MSVELTLDNYLGTVRAIAERDESKIVLNYMLMEATKLFGGKHPSNIWVWQRDNRLARKEYKLPDVDSIDLSLFEGEIEHDVRDIEPIISQLKTSLDLDDYPILFMDKSKIKVDNELAESVLSKLLQLKPAARLESQKFCLDSFDNLKSFSEQ